MGLPVISTDCKGGGARAIVQNGINGILVSVNDEAMMADALREYMDHEETALEMGRKARETAENFKTEVIINQWEEFLLQVAENKMNKKNDI